MQFRYFQIRCAKISRLAPLCFSKSKQEFHFTFPYIFLIILKYIINQECHNSLIQENLFELHLKRIQYQVH